MIGSLYSGLSGLMGYQNAVDITGNNIANQGTIGFKYGRASFGSLFTSNLESRKDVNNLIASDNPGRIRNTGIGTQITSIDTIMTTGIIENTGVFSDLAIGGEGFFFVGPGSHDSGSIAGKIYASRVGNFEKNAFPDLVQTSTGLYLYGFVAEKNANNDFEINNVPTEEEMLDALDNVEKKTEYLNRLEPIKLEEFQSIPPKSSKALAVSGILNSQLGPKKMMRIEISDNQGNPYEVLLEFDRDFSMIDSELGKNYETYTMNLTVKDPSGAEISPIDPSSKTIIFSPDGSMLTESGTTVSNIGITLPGSEITLLKSTLTENVHYTSPKTSSYADIITVTGDVEEVPFTFEKIERGDWVMRPDLPVSGEITEVRLKGANGEYVIANDGSTPLESGGVRLGFATDGSLTSQNIVDENGNTIEALDSIVYVFSDGSTQETAWNASNFSQVASTSDVRIEQEDGRVTGALVNLEFSPDGYLLGNYSNKAQIRLALVPLSRFRSTEAIAPTTTNPLLYQIKFDEETGNVDGNFFGYFRPNQGLTGGLVPYALESSNVDISKEMVNLIKYQRAIQLNSRTVQTADQILQQAIQLKG